MKALQLISVMPTTQKELKSKKKKNIIGKLDTHLGSMDAMGCYYRDIKPANCTQSQGEHRQYTHFDGGHTMLIQLMLL
ncbi:MAG: hypothetical protein WCR86_13535, partial [Parabacteroides sp.]